MRLAPKFTPIYLILGILRELETDSSQSASSTQTVGPKKLEMGKCDGKFSLEFRGNGPVQLRSDQYAYREVSGVGFAETPYGKLRLVLAGNLGECLDVTPRGNSTGEAKESEKQTNDRLEFLNLPFVDLASPAKTEKKSESGVKSRRLLKPAAPLIRSCSDSSAFVESWHFITGVLVGVFGKQNAGKWPYTEDPKANPGRYQSGSQNSPINAGFCVAIFPGKKRVLETRLIENCDLGTARAEIGGGDRGCCCFSHFLISFDFFRRIVSFFFL